MARPTNITLCSFCGKSHAEVKKLIAGPGVYICDNCVILCKNVLDKELAAQTEEAQAEADRSQAGRNQAPARSLLHRPGAREEDAGRRGAQSLQAHPAGTGRNGDAEEARTGMPMDPHAEVEIEKSNILMIGPTGSGKTLARAHARANSRCAVRHRRRDDVDRSRLRRRRRGEHHSAPAAKRRLRREARADAASFTSTKSTRSRARRRTFPSRATFPAKACSRRC